MLTGIAGLDMPAQLGGAAGSNRTQDAPMLAAQITESMAMPPHDLRQLQRGAPERGGHGVFGVGTGTG